MIGHNVLIALLPILFYSAGYLHGKYTSSSFTKNKAATKNDLTEEIDKIIYKRYDNYKPNLFWELKVIHQQMRKEVGDEAFLDLLRGLEQQNTKPFYIQPEIVTDEKISFDLQLKACYEAVCKDVPNKNDVPLRAWIMLSKSDREKMPEIETSHMPMVGIDGYKHVYKKWGISFIIEDHRSDAFGVSSAVWFFKPLERIDPKVVYNEFWKRRDQVRTIIPNPFIQFFTL